MGKLIAAAAVSVTCREPVRFNGQKYLPGEQIDGLASHQAAQLVELGHVEPVTNQAGNAEADAQAAADALAAAAITPADSNGDGIARMNSAGDIAAAAAAAAAAAKTATKRPAKTASKKK